MLAKLMKGKRFRELVFIGQSSLAYFLAGFFVPFFWPYLMRPFGLLTGFIASAFIIGPIWYLSHYRGLIFQKKGSVTVDMGAGIGMAVFVRDSLSHGILSGLSSLPTLFYMALGAVLAGLVAAYFIK